MQASKELQQIPDFKAGPFPYVLENRKDGDSTEKIIFLDTETTGLNPETDKLISLGMVKCTLAYERDRILSIDEVFQEFEDPHEPLSEEIIRITGLHDEDLKLKRIPDLGFWDFIEDAFLVISHNADFDRAFIDRFFIGDDRLLDIPWACTLKEPNWTPRMKENHLLSLPKLLQLTGYTYRAHDSLQDCFALMWFMHQRPIVFSNFLTAVRHRRAAQRRAKLERFGQWRYKHDSIY